MFLHRNGEREKDERRRRESLTKWKMIDKISLICSHMALNRFVASSFSISKSTFWIFFKIYFYWFSSFLHFTLFACSHVAATAAVCAVAAIIVYTRCNEKISKWSGDIKTRDPNYRGKYRELWRIDRHTKLSILPYLPDNKFSFFSHFIFCIGWDSFSTVRSAVHIAQCFFPLFSVLHCFTVWSFTSILFFSFLLNSSADWKDRNFHTKFTSEMEKYKEASFQCNKLL